MEIVEPGTYDFDLDVSFPTPMKELLELPGFTARHSEWTTFRRATSKVTVKGPVEKGALAERLVKETFEGLASEDVTVIRLELTPTSGPTVAELAVTDYMDCIRVAANHVDSCEACQNERFCETGEPILDHFELARDRYQRRESLLV
ncbi:hypothetical protein [Streptomyces chartreusis]|uniref:hypothetical protein n=1 Tax=Streptomyces chartreusis TaxID=1969 RepID=UPI0016733618|nr:hypothetical protein [Streptomyces chartreusis]GGX58936.1 hypothetical protein GCM10010321_89510 [Streptomyces chartreusis]